MAASLAAVHGCESISIHRFRATAWQESLLQRDLGDPADSVTTKPRTVCITWARCSQENDYLLREGQQRPNSPKFNLFATSAPPSTYSFKQIGSSVRSVLFVDLFSKYRTGILVRDSTSGTISLSIRRFIVSHSGRIIAFLRRIRLASLGHMCRFLCILFLAGLATGRATGADAQNNPVASIAPGLPFAVADLDGDRLPDLADIQTGRSNVLLTDYWVQLQLSAAGRQSIRVVAPSPSLQIVARDVNGDHALVRDAVGVPPQLRTRLCSTTLRLPHPGSQESAVPASNCGALLHPPFNLPSGSRTPVLSSSALHPRFSRARVRGGLAASTSCLQSQISGRARLSAGSFTSSQKELLGTFRVI